MDLQTEGDFEARLLTKRVSPPVQVINIGTRDSTTFDGVCQLFFLPALRRGGRHPAKGESRGETDHLEQHGHQLAMLPRPVRIVEFPHHPPVPRHLQSPSVLGFGDQGVAVRQSLARSQGLREEVLAGSAAVPPDDLAGQRLELQDPRPLRPRPPASPASASTSRPRGRPGPPPLWSKSRRRPPPTKFGWSGPRPSPVRAQTMVRRSGSRTAMVSTRCTEISRFPLRKAGSREAQRPSSTSSVLVWKMSPSGAMRLSSPA